MNPSKLDELVKADKNYLTNLLEKKIIYYNEYHLNENFDRFKFIKNNSDLLNKLKKHKLTDFEKKNMKKMVKILKFLRKWVR